MSNSDKNEKIWVIIVIENSAPKPVRKCKCYRKKTRKEIEKVLNSTIKIEKERLQKLGRWSHKETE